MSDNVALWLMLAGSAIVALLTYRHSAHKRGFTMFGRYIGSDSLLPDYDAENDFIDKHSR